MIRQAKSAQYVELFCADAQVVEPQTVTTQRRVYSQRVSHRIERKGGRELWDGARIKEIREERRLSQKEVAALAGSTDGEISRHERNAPNSNPAVDVLVRISRALDVPLPCLFEPVGTPIPRPDEGEAGHADADDRSQGSALLERVLHQLDSETPAEDSWRGDVLKAVAALNRALRRTNTDDGAATSDRSTARPRR